MSEQKQRYKGTISYAGLFEKMNEQGIKKKDLREKWGISPTIVKRLSDNTNVAVDTIMYLCEILNCQPGDILAYVPE